MRLIVDRIEKITATKKEIVVCEDENGKMRNISGLPFPVKEGDFLLYNEEQHVFQKQTPQEKPLLKEKMRKLFKNNHATK